MEPSCDAELAGEIGRRLRETGCMQFLSGHNMGAPFDSVELAELRRFCELHGDGRRRFTDRGLERAHRALVRACEGFLTAVDEVAERGSGKTLSVPRMWIEEDPGRFDAAVYRLNRLASRVVSAYRELRELPSWRLAQEGTAGSG